MYTRKYYFKQPFTIIGFLFLFTGFAFISMSLITAKLDKVFQENATEAEGIIDRIYAQDVYVAFEANGETISTRLNFYSSSMRPGDSITLYYDNDDPYNIRTPNSKILNWIFLGVGALLISLGLSLVLSQFFKRNKNNNLRETGIRLNAEIVNVGLDMRISSNYRHPFVIDCRYQAPDGTFYMFHSDPIWQNPTKYLTNDYIPVYVEPTNYKKYYVDLASILPNELL